MQMSFFSVVTHVGRRGPRGAMHSPMASLVASMRSHTTIQLGSSTTDFAASHRSPPSIRLPRLIFFGGDVVSATALEAIHERMCCIVRCALLNKKQQASSSSSSRGNNHENNKAITKDELSEAEVAEMVRQHITIVCPSIPPNTTPHSTARTFSRQYPVLRFCVAHGLSVVPVDHPTSLAKSGLLKEMMREEGRRSGGEGKALLRRANTSSNSNSNSSNNNNTSATSCAPSAKKEDAEEKEMNPSELLSRTLWRKHGFALDRYDLAVVVSFRYFIPKRLLLALPPTINLHPSLLPKYRGASPIFSTLLQNESVGGVSIIEMRHDQRGMDSGNILWQCEVPIHPDTTIRTYFPIITQVGAAGLCDVIFGEHPRNDVRPHISLGATSMKSGLQCAKSVSHSEWRTLCRPPSHINPAAVSAASDTHRRLFFERKQRDDGASKPARQTKLSGEAATPPPGHARDPFVVRCAELFPSSVLTPHCDWPDSFTYSWRFALPQTYPTFASFREDPFHAPLLPKDAAVLRFSRHTCVEAFGVWRAFAGGQYFQPAVNATVDKGCSPVREQLLQRTIHRLTRSARRSRSSNANNNNNTSSSSRDEADSVPAEVIRVAEESLRSSCAFVDAVSPALVSEDVMAELVAVEEGGSSFYTASCYTTCTAPTATTTTTSSSSSSSSSSIIHAGPPQPAPGNGGRRLMHIPTGTAYFPRSDVSVGAIKCAEGWFLWRSALMKDAKAQPASLIRKGLAMKTGVLYCGLFSEYS